MDARAGSIGALLTTSDLPSAFCLHHSDTCVFEMPEARHLVWSTIDDRLTIAAWPTHSWQASGVRYGSSDYGDLRVIFSVLNFA